MKILVESEFQGQKPPRTQETTKTTSTIRTPRVGFGTDRPYIALFWRRNWERPKQCFCFVFVLFCVLFLLVLVVLVVVLVLLGVVLV